ncbi:hypothetical protein K435DRAFT_851535 [Dendrothele bispora CBS 962.96]|uniref:Family A G protein-coupled receptor-like protein n=1 Tax=Dendrothele bispora (strain CBS 962.96) TaxID=1314807 RepID=A0A4S8MLM1_DENBC|nr:hypothetical protein K435DRAFT_851535 [Dendrothele bispora CBS 962.96]
MSLPQTQSSFPLSDSDLLVLRGWILQQAMYFLLFGVQVTLSTVVLCIFVAPGIPLSKAKLALSFVTVTMFLASLSSLVMSTEDIIVQIPFNGYNPPDLGESISLDTGLNIGLNFMRRLNFLMGDIIIVWRAWVLFPRKLPAKMILSICLMGSFVGVFLDTGLFVKRILKDYFDTNGGETNVIMLAVPLIFTNLTATMLIGLKAWYHFQDIQNNLGLTNGSSSKVLKILLLMVESGLLYLAFWIGYLVLGLVAEAHNTSIAQEVYLAIMPQLVAIYPILIILLVAHENNKSESVNDMSLSQSIQFASAQASKSGVNDSGGGSPN